MTNYFAKWQAATASLETITNDAIRFLHRAEDAEAECERLRALEAKAHEHADRLAEKARQLLAENETLVKENASLRAEAERRRVALAGCQQSEAYARAEMARMAKLLAQVGKRQDAS